MINKDKTETENPILKVDYSFLLNRHIKKKKVEEPPQLSPEEIEAIEKEKEYQRIYKSVLGQCVKEFKTSFNKAEIDYLRRRQFKIYDPNEETKVERPDPNKIKCFPQRIKVKDNMKYWYRDWRSILQESFGVVSEMILIIK